MKKKILAASILAVVIIIAVSFTSAVNTNETKESPLYRIRARRAISEKISNIIEKIKARFLGERMFFILPIDGFYKTGTRPWTSMCTQIPTTMPGCGAFCTVKCQNNNMNLIWTDSKGNCDTSGKVYCTFTCPS